MGTGCSRFYRGLSKDFLSRLTLDSSDRSPEGVVFGGVPLTEDAFRPFPYPVLSKFYTLTAVLQRILIRLRI